MRSALRHARSIAHHEAVHSTIPIFLCPALLRVPSNSVTHYKTRPSSIAFSTIRALRQQAAVINDAATTDRYYTQSTAVESPARCSLPLSCPGCGAPTQVYDKGEAGYYDVDRSAVRKYLHYDPNEIKEDKVENDVYAQALQQADPKLLEELGVHQSVLQTPSNPVKVAAPQTPICDRCHNLVHHNT